MPITLEPLHTRGLFRESVAAGIVARTAIDLDEELLNRCLVLTVDDRAPTQACG
jgi:hypothetical protein